MQEHSQAFKEYVAGRDYKLHTVKGYGGILKKAGFREVSGGAGRGGGSEV